MELALNIGLGAWIGVILAALVFGVVAQYIGQAGTGYEWLITAVAFGVGAVAASEFVIGWRGIEPVVDQLALIPAVGGGLVVGLVVELATRMVTGGTYRGADQPQAL